MYFDVKLEDIMDELVKIAEEESKRPPGPSVIVHPRDYNHAKTIAEAPTEEAVKMLRDVMAGKMLNGTKPTMGMFVALTYMDKRPAVWDVFDNWKPKKGTE